VIKQRVQMVIVGFILVVLVQRVCGWAGFGISWLWFRRLLALLFLAPTIYNINDIYTRYS